MTALKSFFAALNYQEESFKKAIKQDRLGLIMRCAVNELDWFAYNFSRAEDPTEEQQEQLYILQLGTSRLVKLALEVHEVFELPVVTARRNRDLSIRVLQLVSGLGMVQHGRRVAQTVAHGVGFIEQAGENDFVIKLPQNIEDQDFYEREVLRHYNLESRRLFSELTRTETWETISEEVETLLHDLVYPFMDHYIGYDADPVLDNFFYGLATHELSLQEGYDTYHYATSFGGIRMQSYTIALTYLVAISIRHERFAETLVEKDSDVKLENVLTISADIEPFVESLRDAVNYFGSHFQSFEEITLAEAQQIFGVLSLSRQNTKLIDAPGSPCPLLIVCSDTGVIRSIFGARAEPMRFLLESLRFHFPQDYGRNQADREASLQRAMRRVLDDCFSAFEYRENVKIRLGGNILSDIDLVVIDRPNRAILLCQLKYQELYGADLHARAIRANRLRDQVEKWLRSLTKWLSNLTSEEVLEALQLPRAMIHDLSIYQLVISRHFAFPLKSVVSGEDKAFANWVQFYNAVQIVKRDYSNPDLESLVSVLQSTQTEPELVTHLEEPKSKWHINELTFTTQPYEGGRT